MLHSSLCRSALALGAVLLAAAGARADNVDWSYNWTPLTSKVAATTGSGWIEMTNEPVGSAEDTSDIVASNLISHSTATTKTPDVFTNAAYKLSLTLIDEVSKQSATLSFTGEFNGTMTAKKSLISNTFTGPVTQTAVLGGNTYTVTINSFTPPSPPTATQKGAISAIVKVSQDVGGGGQTPEPSGLVLAGLGLAGLGAGCWRRRARRAALSLA
jgi:hypothetical protein